MIFNTVRRKLTALVLFSAVAALAMLPILWWLTHRQLLEQVHARLPAAVRGFEEELDDDIADLDVTAIAIAGEPSALAAMSAPDHKDLDRIVAPFRAAYPDLDLLFFGADGKLVVQYGCANPRKDVPKKLARATHLVLAHGCELGDDAPVAIAIIRPIGDAGSLMVCLPLDRPYFTNAQAKINGELALEVTNQKTHGGQRYTEFATDKFPAAGLAVATDRPAVYESGATWALATFVPKAISDSEQRVELRFAAALDVSAIKRIVRNHLMIAAMIVLGTAIIALSIGWRLASRMATALARVNAAMRRLEQQEYVKVEAVRTGDELEDLANGFNSMVDGLRERDKLRVTMGKYMTEEVLEHVLNGAVELGGKTIDLTILFCDLRDFTTLSEKRTAQQIVALLNEYFTHMVDCVMAEGGVVDKYIGDNIMAVFGAPVTRPDDAQRAVRAAVRMRAALAELNESFTARGMEKLRFGIGLHSGEVVAGNIGSARRMEYTVIGDAVNLASRLESKTKELATDIIISEATRERLDPTVTTELLGEVHVKGRAEPAQIYKVVSITGI
ncbi:MAG TPA: adenylate/guanylate cyclase domain-containing protein [Kofleriaceae bacterium]|jgi:adenylate cyclase